MDPVPTSPTVGDSLRRLAEALDATPLDLDIGSIPQTRTIRSELTSQIHDYLIPRLRRLNAPLLAVLGGSTGSGKSTITNSLVGAEVSPSGVLRPTTRSPVLVVHPADVSWFASDEILPDLARTSGFRPQDQSEGESSGQNLRVIEVDRIGPGLAILDAPDIDSVEEANRSLATQLLGAADLWLFTTSAVRYADAVPWEFLRRAQTRGASLAVIINRIPPGATNEIVAHMSDMLKNEALADVAIYPVETAELINGQIPVEALGHLPAMLRQLADDAEKRHAVVAHTLAGALHSVQERTRLVLNAGREQQQAVHELMGVVDEVYAAARSDLRTDLATGNLLRGEVLERWQELIGTAELMRAVQTRISWMRDRIVRFATGKVGAQQDVKGEITSTIAQLVVDYADRAALMTTSTWKNLPGGNQILASDRSLERSTPQLAPRLEEQVRAWQDDVMGLVREKGGSKRTVARVLALGVNSVGLALMIVLFSQTAGLSGGEVAIGAGTASLSQALLNAIFGDQAVRELATEARDLLEVRMNTVLEDEAARFADKLNQTAAAPQALENLDAALKSFATARSGTGR